MFVDVALINSIPIFRLEIEQAEINFQKKFQQNSIEICIGDKCENVSHYSNSFGF